MPGLLGLYRLWLGICILFYVRWGAIGEFEQEIGLSLRVELGAC